MWCALEEPTTKVEKRGRPRLSPEAASAHCLAQRECLARAKLLKRFHNGETLSVEEVAAVHMPRHGGAPRKPKVKRAAIAARKRRAAAALERDHRHPFVTLVSVVVQRAVQEKKEKEKERAMELLAEAAAQAARAEEAARAEQRRQRRWDRELFELQSTGADGGSGHFADVMHLPADDRGGREVKPLCGICQDELVLPCPDERAAGAWGHTMCCAEYYHLTCVQSWVAAGGSEVWPFAAADASRGHGHLAHGCPNGKNPCATYVCKGAYDAVTNPRGVRWDSPRVMVSGMRAVDRFVCH